jgi:hypothetical protein
VLRPLVESVSNQLRAATTADGTDLAKHVREGMKTRNVAGLADDGRNRMYPVDLDALVEKADLLGLTPEEIRSQLHRLRGLKGA